MAALEELGGRIQALEKRMHALEDLQAIKKLKARYGELADERSRVKEKEELEVIASEMAKLFTEDGVWDGGEVFGIRKGRKEIYEYFRQPAWKLGLHYFMNPHVTIEGNKARGRWYLLLPGTTKDNTAVWMAGFEDDEYVKMNGQWLKSRMKLTLLFLTPYDQGWVKRRMIG